MFSDIRIKKEKLYNDFFNKIPKNCQRWNYEELTELKYAKNFYNKHSDEIELYDIYNNYVFSFHIYRSFGSIKMKFYKIEEEEVNFKILKMKSRFKYLEELLKKKIK